MTFPEQLRSHRQRKNLTQADLAKQLDVSPRAIWQWEQGKLPHILTREGALARIKGKNKKSLAPEAGKSQ